MTGSAVLHRAHRHHLHADAPECRGRAESQMPSLGIPWPQTMPGLPVQAGPEQLFTAARQLIDNLESAVQMLTPAQPMGSPWVRPSTRRTDRWHGHVHGRCDCHPQDRCDCHPQGRCDCDLHRSCNCHPGGWAGCGESECSRCGPDSCACTCCVCDSDAVIRTRVGEQRVVSIMIENDRRREKDITLELSPWTTRGGRPAPVQATLTPTSATIEPCGEVAVTLVVQVTGATAGQRDQAEPAEPNLVQAFATQPAQGEAGRLPDVDECLVAYADLRITGCEIRPLRLAVAILPRECETVPVHCGCGCC